MLVTQFIHVAFGTRGSDTTGKYTAHEVDDLADVRQLLGVLSEKVQDVDPEFVMQSLENIMDGSFMVWLQDRSKGTTSADGAQLIQRTLHLLPHSHYPVCLPGPECQTHHHHSKCNMVTPKGTSSSRDSQIMVTSRWALGHANSSTALITSLGLRCSKGKNASRAISHNLTLGYSIGYDKYRSLSPQIRRGPLDTIRDCARSGDCYDYVVLA